MEWKKIPSKKPLETSRDEGGERKVYSREAGDSSREVTRGGSDGRERPRMVQPRRRRRISEMPPTHSGGWSASSFEQRPSSYQSDSYGEYQRERSSRNEEHNYYREQYKQVRETQRQRFGEGAKKPSRPPQRNAPRNKKRTGPVPPVYEGLGIDPTETIRLNKFLSNAGVCSRREADDLIKAGAVLVNGLPITELGTKITAQDRVEVNGREVMPENKVYLLLNKPRNCVTTTDDPQERMTVMHLVRSACKERVYPVGRLDRNTTGVLLLTNDGDLAAKLVHPSYKKKKIYHVWLDKEVSAEDMQKIADGIELEDGEMHADAISYVTEEDLTQVGIEIHSGRNRIVRRIFEHLGYHVRKLDRVYFAGLTKKNLGRGKWRYLTQEEVNNLQMGAFE